MDPADRLVAAPRSRVRTTVGAVVVLVIVAAATAVLVLSLGGGGVTTVVDVDRGASDSSESASTGAVDPSALETDPLGSPTRESVFVHVLGAVAEPGLYELSTGDRAVDVIAAAGGFTPEADRSVVNLARLVSDGEQIRIPAIGEAPPPEQGTDGGASGATPGSGSLVNLNTADAAALDTLPGVGPATAARILEWRETNGRFESIEDLLSVSGIGEKTFAELEPLVSI